MPFQIVSYVQSSLKFPLTLNLTCSDFFAQDLPDVMLKALLVWTGLIQRNKSYISFRRKT